jgi:hypothetical protein
MAYTITNNQLGLQPIAAAAPTGTTTTALGTDANAYDPTFGGEFIYLLGVASNIVGALVTYNQLTGAVTLAATTGNQNRPLAVSMNANTSTTTGSWYQVSGAAVIKKIAIKVSPGVPLFVNGSGRVTATASAGKQVLNAISVNAATVASATSTVTAQIQFPFAQGQIT